MRGTIGSGIQSLNDMETDVGSGPLTLGPPGPFRLLATPVVLPALTAPLNRRP